MLPITVETVREWFAYKDGRLVWAKRLGRSGAGAKAGSKKLDGYITVKFQGHSYQVHRLVWMVHHGATELQIDHINGIRDDNRIENLRAVTHAENQHCRKAVWGAVPLKGVCLDKKSGRFIAQIAVGGKRTYLGRHETPEKAHAAYAEAAKVLHGRFAETGHI